MGTYHAREIILPQTIQDASLWALKHKEYCDVTFTFPNLPDRVEAHELFLKIRSPVFKQIFRMRKSGNVKGREIEINESTPERFQEFLEFIYTDKLEVNAAGALDLLHLAQKYKVQPLMSKCEELLLIEIKVEDSVQVFETARRYGRDEVVDRAGRTMAKPLGYLIENDALENAEEETLVYLLKSDELFLKEVELFEFILKWGKNQISPPGGGNVLQDKLKNVIPLIRYTNMTPHEFKTVVVPTRLLSAEEMLSVYSYLAEDELARKNVEIKFNTTPRNVESKELDFYTGNKDETPRFRSTSYYPLKLCTSFQVLIKKKLWSDLALKKPAITAIKVKWPSRKVEKSEMLDRSLNFNVCVKDSAGPLNEQSVRLRLQKNLLNCKDGEENEIPVEPPVELISGVTYGVIVEDLSRHHASPCYNSTVYYTYSGVFTPYNLLPEASVDLGVVDLRFKGIQKDNRLPGFKYSTADFPINVIRGIRVSLV